MRGLLAVAAALTLATPLLAGEVGEQPKGVPPKVMTASVEKDGRVFLLHLIAEVRPLKEKVKILVNGQEQEVERTVYEQVMKQVKVYLDDKGVQVFGTDGKKIPAKEVAKGIKKPTAVLVSSDGKPVDPFYTRIAREGTLIVVAPSLATGAMPPGPVPPVPMPKDPPKEKPKT